MAEKKYYWLKLKEDFFRGKEIKKLRRIAGGDTYTIIYLKMQLLSLKNNGSIYFEGVEDNIAEELALELDESVENVQMTLSYLSSQQMIEQKTVDEYFMTKVPEVIGKETATAERMRRSRERKKLEGQENVTLLQGVTEGYTEIRDKSLEKEKEIEKEIEKDLIVSKDTICSSNLLRIVEEWNSLGLTDIKKINPNTNRHTLLKARIKEYGEDEVIKAIQSIKKSTFLRGQNDKGWTISFDWFVKPVNFLKVLEGKYLDKEGVKPSGSGSGSDNKHDPYAELESIK